MKKTALVTGVTGQVGSFMAEYLLKKDYKVHGLNRRKSIDNFENINHIINDIEIVEGDLTDSTSIDNIINKGKYDCIFNLAAQSHVKISFEQPITTFEIDALGVLHILEAIRKHSNHTRMYQASTSELFGSSPAPQNELTSFKPQSPYACAKLAAHHLVHLYHEGYKLRAACGIMFNSESSKRGKNFVTRKITEWVAKYRAKFTNVNTTDLPYQFDAYLDLKDCVLELGNLDAKRDWLHVNDSVEAIYRICYQDMYYQLGYHGDNWKSYCFGSGKSYSVREFLSRALELAFDIEFGSRFEFRGSGLDEVLFDKVTGLNCVQISPKFFRPAEVNHLECDYTTISNELGWYPKYDLDFIISDMLSSTLHAHNKSAFDTFTTNAVQTYTFDMSNPWEK